MWQGVGERERCLELSALVDATIPFGFPPSGASRCSREVGVARGRCAGKTITSGKLSSAYLGERIQPTSTREAKEEGVLGCVSVGGV